MIHIAILKRIYIQQILAGQKTIESRMTRTRQAPHDAVKVGERLFLKVSGGEFMATAVANRVKYWQDATPQDIDHIREKYGKCIGGDDTYWQAKRESRFVTLIWLDEVEPLDVGPPYKPAYMRAWYVLPDSQSPIRETVLTEGSIRNNYAAFPSPAESTQKPGHAITLILPDQERIDTEIVAGHRLRWRGWKKYFEKCNAQAGDRLRYVAVDKDVYAVTCVRQKAGGQDA